MKRSATRTSQSNCVVSDERAIQSQSRHGAADALSASHTAHIPITGQLPLSKVGWLLCIPCGVCQYRIPTTVRKRFGAPGTISETNCSWNCSIKDCSWESAQNYTHTKTELTRRTPIMRPYSLSAMYMGRYLCSMRLKERRRLFTGPASALPEHSTAPNFYQPLRRASLHLFPFSLGTIDINTASSRGTLVATSCH